MKKRNDDNLVEVQSIVPWEEQREKLAEAGISSADLAQLDALIDMRQIAELEENKGKKRGPTRSKIRKALKVAWAVLKKSWKIGLGVGLLALTILTSAIALPELVALGVPKWLASTIFTAAPTALSYVQIASGTTSLLGEIKRPLLVEAQNG